MRDCWQPLVVADAHGRPRHASRSSSWPRIFGPRASWGRGGSKPPRRTSYLAPKFCPQSGFTVCSCSLSDAPTRCLRAAARSRLRARYHQDTASSAPQRSSPPPCCANVFQPLAALVAKYRSRAIRSGLSTSLLSRSSGRRVGGPRAVECRDAADPCRHGDPTGTRCVRAPLCHPNLPKDPGNRTDAP
jgi:hypothetical protein